MYDGNRIVPIVSYIKSIQQERKNQTHHTANCGVVRWEKSGVATLNKQKKQSILTLFV